MCCFKSFVMSRNHIENVLCLTDLPPEMIRHIATFLPTHSVAAFALCSHHLKWVLGTDSWEELGRTTKYRERHTRLLANRPGKAIARRLIVEEPKLEGEREHLLKLLERDLKDQIFCERCAIIHFPPLKSRHRDDRNRPCYLANLYFNSPCGHRFSVIQIAMKRHRMGLDYRNCLEADHTLSMSYTLPN
jgi:hypothetical protein